MNEYIKRLVYSLLINEKIYSLPMLIATLSAKYKIRFVTYQDVTYLSRFQKKFLIEQCGKKAFIFYDEDVKKFVIAYNNRESEIIIKFAIAHEFAHFFLKHVDEKNDYLLAHLDKKNLEEVETEANLFATFMLCPPVVIKECNVENWKELKELCCIADIYAQQIYPIIVKDKATNVEQEKKIKKQFSKFIINYKKQRLMLSDLD